MTQKSTKAFLERDAGVAIWRQVADALRQQISHNKFELGQRLPGEIHLAKEFDCNRHTVRAALDALAKEGIVEARQGQGTFLLSQERITYPIGKRTRFSEGIAAQAASVAASLLESVIEPAEEKVARRLEIPAGQVLVRLETMSRADERPVARATHWFDAKRFSDIGNVFKKTGSITKSLQKLGVSDYFRRSTKIQALHASGEDALNLGLSAGAIVLMTRALNVDTSGHPIQYSHTRFAADRVSLSVENDV